MFEVTLANSDLFLLPPVSLNCGWFDSHPEPIIINEPQTVWGVKMTRDVEQMQAAKNGRSNRTYVRLKLED